MEVYTTIDEKHFSEEMFFYLSMSYEEAIM